MWKSCLKIKEAAEFLGVSPQTLRTWDKNKKLPALRHPLNKYRLYKIAELENFLRKTNAGKSTRSKIKLID